jgi:pSer/pThr/pTyr-binding forkhead associated (FHA) protein
MSLTIVCVCNKTFSNDSSFVVGRRSDCDFQLQKDSISRRHARVSIEHDGRIVVSDIDSLNGIYVNGVRVNSEVLENPETDNFTLCGKYQLHFVRLEPSDEERAQGVTNKYHFTYIVP